MYLHSHLSISLRLSELSPSARSETDFKPIKSNTVVDILQKCQVSF